MNKSCNCMRGFNRLGVCSVCNTPYKNNTNSRSPFSLEKALSGKKVVCRTGEQVLDIARLQNSETAYSLVGRVEGEKHLNYWLTSGRFLSNSTSHSFDLFMEDKLYE